MNRSTRISILGQFIFLLFLLTARSASAQPLLPVYFDQILEKRQLSTSPGVEWTFDNFCPISSDVVAMRVLLSYGSMFVANESMKLPKTCVLKGEGDVLKFQRKLEKKTFEIKGVRITLQTGAATALESAIAEATALGFQITPFDGAIAGGRSYGDTLMLWNSRVFPAMDFWIKRGRLPVEARDEIGRLDLEKKIAKVLEWESQGMFFSTDRTRSILTSTAPPGTSQHLALIAFDVTEYWNPEVRAILHRNGWFQTVVDDPLHFTFLGFSESELPTRGLRAVYKGNHQYWIPNLSPTAVTPTN